MGGGRAFFLPIFFSFQPRREPKWTLEMTMAGCPEKSCPHSLVQSSSFFLLSPCQGEGKGPASHCVSCPLHLQSHDRVPPPPLLLHHLTATQPQHVLGTRLDSYNDHYSHFTDRKTEAHDTFFFFFWFHLIKGGMACSSGDQNI